MPPGLIAGRNGRAGRRDSGHGEPRRDMECISFEPWEERNPAEEAESIEKWTAGAFWHYQQGWIVLKKVRGMA
jgi:hypothetical protein